MTRVLWNESSREKTRTYSQALTTNATLVHIQSDLKLSLFVIMVFAQANQLAYRDKMQMRIALFAFSKDTQNTEQMRHATDARE